VSAEPLDLEFRYGGAPAAGLRTSPERRVGGYERFVKPVVDRGLALIFLLILLPVILLTAILVIVEFGRPVLFTQRRIGRDNRVFTLYKFRTMAQDRRTAIRSVHGVPQERRVTHKSRSDPRHTKVGRVLRKCSLDELPQLWNVLRGDMSMVGPRPELEEVVQRYEEWQHRRHVVKPGLTGLWQVSRRGEEPMHMLTHVDLAYVDALSLRADVSILLRTPVAVVFKRRGC
jgi:lipopolysaccharide/colanic/teichoic acid biosynthesis glycosyltransferase